MQTGGVGQQDLVVAGEHEQLRQAREVAKQGRDQGVLQFMRLGIKAGGFRQGLGVEHHINLGLGAHGFATAGQVGPGREQQSACGHGQALLTRGKHAGQGQATARRVAREHHLVGRHALRQQGLPPGQGVVHGGREGVFGGHAVVHRQHLGLGRAGQVGTGGPVRGQATEEVAATVEVQHRALRVGRAQPFGGAQALGRIGGHAGVVDFLRGRWVTLGQLVHLLAGKSHIDGALGAVLELPTKNEVRDGGLNAHAGSFAFSVVCDQWCDEAGVVVFTAGCTVYWDSLKLRVFQR